MDSSSAGSATTARAPPSPDPTTPAPPAPTPAPAFAEPDDRVLLELDARAELRPEGELRERHGDSSLGGVVCCAEPRRRPPEERDESGLRAQIRPGRAPGGAAQEARLILGAV